MLHRAQNKENKMDFSVAWSVRKMGTDLMSDPSKSAFIMARCETFCGCFFPLGCVSVRVTLKKQTEMKCSHSTKCSLIISGMSKSRLFLRASNCSPYAFFFSHQSDGTLKTHLKQKMFHKWDWCGTRSLPLFMLWRENDWLSGTQPWLSRGSQPRSTW